MSYSLVLLPLARNNLSKALESRQSTDTKRALLAELNTSFENIRERPRRYPIVYAQMRRALTRRFHFSIFFRIVEERNEVVIAGVFHQSQDPALWPERELPPTPKRSR